MAIRFIVDSASDILPAEAAHLGITVLPTKVLFGDREYADSVDLTHREFYEKLIETELIPTTSQVSPGDFADACRAVVEQGDEVILITVSSRLSGTHQSACIAASDFPGLVWVVDSENVCVGERLLVLRGLELLEQGLSAPEIAFRLNEEKKQIRVLALLDTLEYLKKGGRISASAAFAGSLLSIKPVIAIEDGLVVMAGKARGSRLGNNLLRERIAKQGIDFSRPLCLAYSGLSDSVLQKYIADSAELWQDRLQALPIATIGCTIGAHAGPGAIAVAFFAEA